MKDKNRKKILEKYEGKKIFVVGDRDRISVNCEKMNGAKILIKNITVVGEEDIIDHVWISPPKKSKSNKGDKVAFTGIVKKYISLDEDAKVIDKYGLVSIRNFRVGKTRDEAATATKKSIDIGILHQKRIKNEKK